MERTRCIEGGVTAARGFRAAGIACGIKKSGALDLALVMADAPCPTVGVFTKNIVKAHPVLDAREKLQRGGRIGGILVNSGSANACTGPEGMDDLREVLRVLGLSSGLPAGSLLMSSTGVIGERLPTAKITGSLDRLVAALAGDGNGPAARAIMTTDTFPKECAMAVELPEGTITIGGMAKGAGMIAPNMATMLAFITTDALIADRRALRKLLREAADISFNRVDCDSDTSTNDSLVLMAGGAAGVNPLPRHREAFAAALGKVCVALAKMIAGDTEGATKLITVTVRGGRNDRQASAAARTVAQSPLVKTAVHGQDPNWGRIMAALGRSGAAFDPQRVNISINGLPLVLGGIKNPGVSEADARASLKPREVEILIDLAAGKGSGVIWSGDLTADYVRINASYRS